MKILSTIDKSNMRQVILDFPKQFKIGTEAAKNISIPSLKRPLSNIIICGMGGSALPGDLLKMFNSQLSMTNLPIFVHRDYRLLKEADKKSLIICISYSGNTEETLSTFGEALKKKLRIVSIASGGKLIEFSRKHKIPFAKIPRGIQPRCALGYQFAALLKILSNLKIIKNIERSLLDLEKILIPQNLEGGGEKLARKLKGFIPLVYSSGKYQQLARIWKIKFNENSKIPAFFNILPELNHNEMTGIGECEDAKIRKSFFALILEDTKENPKVLKRMRILSQIFRERDIKIIFLDIKGKNILEKIFASLLLAEWTSYYLAINQRIDPTPVALVEEFKKRMSF